MTRLPYFIWANKKRNMRKNLECSYYNLGIFSKDICKAAFCVVVASDFTAWHLFLRAWAPRACPAKQRDVCGRKKCSNLQPTCRNFQLETVLRANSHDRCFLCGRKTPPAWQYKPVQNARSPLHFSIHAFVVHRLDPMIIEHLGESGPQCLTSIQPDKRQDRPKHDFPLSTPLRLCRWGRSLG